MRQMDLFLRKVDHPQAADNYRVVADLEGLEIEIGSIGTAIAADSRVEWRWGIDTVIPMRELESEGNGADRKDCMRRFRQAWDRFRADDGRLAEFLEAKRRSRRG